MIEPIEANPPQTTKMRAKAWIVWAIDVVAVILLTIAAAKYAYFQSDVTFSTALQSVVGEQVGWARTMTNLASAPYLYVLVTLTATLAWWMAGWRGAALALVSFLALWSAEPYLKSLVARPRPAATLVHVFGTPSGYSFPSGFGLIFFSTIGYLAVLAHHQFIKLTRWIIVAICVGLLVMGGCARVALGAHWLSDIYGAYAIGFTWTQLLVLVGLPKLNIAQQREH